VGFLFLEQGFGQEAELNIYGCVVTLRAVKFSFDILGVAQLVLEYEDVVQLVCLSLFGYCIWYA
jgi:hypothetical protein